MTRLGSVLGAILAELTRARAIADELTKELVDQYENDPVLSSLTVPRISLGEAEVAVRFVVSDVEESVEVEPDATATRDAWAKHFSAKVLPNVINGMQLEKEERAAVLEVLGARAVQPPRPGRAAPIAVRPPIIAVRPPIGDVRTALKGNHKKLVISTVNPIMDRFTNLPPALKRKLGGKAVFTAALSEASAAGLESLLRDQTRSELIKAALASKVNVSVASADLPEDPTKVQEIRLTLRSDDLSSLVELKEEAD